MGLMLSVLVGCVGVLELLACLRHVSRSALVTLNPPTPCLSYHDQEIENQSTHDSLCNFSHSSDVWLPRSAKRKLENLHEYSLRIRSELRSIDKSYDGSTYSEWSAGDYLGSRSCSRSCSRPDSRHDSRPDSRLDSRLSPDYDYEAHENALWNERGAIQDGYDELEEERKAFAASMQARLLDVEASRASTTLIPKETQQYVRIPTPIPFALGEEISRSPSSSDISLSNDSGNEAPTKEIFDFVPIIGRQRRDSMEDGSSIDESDREDQELVRQILLRGSVSASPEPPRPTCKEVFTESTLEVSRSIEVLQGREIIPSVLIDLDLPVEEQDINQVSSHKRTKSSKSSTSILRKPTRLKSRNAEISKSAENLSGKTKSKRHREPDRRKSEIVIQKFRDEWTNTSPPGSTPSLSRSESKRSVSVEVQTSFEEKLNDEEALVEYEDSVVGLSESRRDLTSRDRFGRRSFKNRRFPRAVSSGKREDDEEEEEKFVKRRSQTVTNVRRVREESSWYPEEEEEEEEEEDEATRLLRISKFEEAEEGDYERIREAIRDVEKSRRKSGWRRRRREEESSRSKSSFEDEEDFVSAEEPSAGPIQYTIPDTNQNKAFWLIFSGEYTKAMNKDWHSGHFCCWQCDESLTGQRYVLRDEHPYCIKCYESVFANGCEECNKIIGIDSKDLSYKDKHWHEACFLCNRCRVSLVDKQFGSKVDKIYCGNCYDAQFASRCDGCGEIFRAGTKKMEYKTRQWHEKCFCCVVCKNPIGTKSFIPREQEIYCAGCYEDKFATRCVKCNKIITSGGVTYKNEPWHRDCFTCSNCNNSLAGQRFTSRDDKPYCADCFGELFAKRCTACSKPITGIGGTRFISFEDRHWHNDCFICAGCKVSLVGRGFITDNEDIICPECAKQKLM